MRDRWKMFHLKYIFYFTRLSLILSTPQVNLHYTDWPSENHNALHYNCLRVPVEDDRVSIHLEMISYCMNEFSGKFDVKKDSAFPKFTFFALSQENITIEQLYLWSAPIDLIERYQFYLNRLSISASGEGEEVFYNCTLPRFGPVCQYELVYHYPNHFSLNEIIDDFYHHYEYDAMTNLTCYAHLQCNHGLSPSCLDWIEICDGKIDCLGDGRDEADCWQLEINQCRDNEYRCINGQCIPQSFYQDEGAVADCVDISDEPSETIQPRIFCRYNDRPSIACEDTFVLNSYLDKQVKLRTKARYSSANRSVAGRCLSAFKRLLNFSDSEYSSCEYDQCREIVQSICPEMFYFPIVPVLFGDIYFAYRKTDFQYPSKFPLVSFYICYENPWYNEFFTNTASLSFNKMTCIHSEEVLTLGALYSTSLEVLHIRSIKELYGLLHRYHVMFNYTSKVCHQSSMYQCMHSVKCISVSRLLNGVDDCPYLDDENMTLINTSDIIKLLEKTHFKCQTAGKYIPQSFVRNGVCSCQDDTTPWCEDEHEYITYLKTNIVFQHICDGFLDHLPVLIMNRNETDETECAQWECINIYTRCNGVWNCLNGADEAGCISYATLNCSSKQHYCTSPDTNQLTCLSIEKANDGNVDCLGATDEPDLCQIRYQLISSFLRRNVMFRCMNPSSESCISSSDLCNEINDCEDGDDEQFCTNRPAGRHYRVCSLDYDQLSDVEQFLCKYRDPLRLWRIIQFTLDGMIEFDGNQERNIENTMKSSSSVTQITNKDPPRCQRGLDLHVWTSNFTENTCLCPPSFYGDQCQYQNQRISLAIKFRAPGSSWQTLFAIVISLIDDSNERIIHSYEQLTFLSVRDCQMKFHMYLLYSTRPKDPAKYYSIHIDIYEKASLAYRGGLLFPIAFSFLPVYRLALIANIPRKDDKTMICPQSHCENGQCIQYSNIQRNDSFCQCHPGWTGKYCTIPYICRCASDLMCIGVSANNRSICLCPINEFGPRCLLLDTTCSTTENSTCANGGQCIPNNDYIITDRKFTCICRQGFSGHRCEVADSNITLVFAEDIILSQSVFIHFIEVFDTYNAPVRSTTFKTIPVHQESVVMYWSRPFHLVFVELLDKKYYLAVVQKAYNRSAAIVRTIRPSDRCRNISEVMNTTIVQWHLLRRIKYYHLPCQTYSPDLLCFYDDVHLCLCEDFDGKRLANCFKFNHNMTFDCSGQSECENGGQCFQDKPDCPERSICICPSCFYGTRCQFSTSGFGLSLDAILGYHIFSHLRLAQQPFITLMSLVLTIIFVLAGLVNGILSLITFKNRKVREVGCGLYLLGSSITSLLITMMFGFKFLFLILAQMSLLSKRSFLSFQCHTIDFLLRVCLYMDQWLNACVACERTIMVVKGASFVKKRSKQAAQFVISILAIVVVGSCVHDPIYRRLIDEENTNEKQARTWCVVSYSPSFAVHNYIMHILHFFGPFLINIASTVILIASQARQKSDVQIHQSYKEHLWQQFREHRHLLIAPIVLIGLAVPRLIISFLSKCMQSANDSWLFLIGYFISFLPPMLTLVVFIVPSTFYREELGQSVQQFRTVIQRRFRRM